MAWVDAPDGVLAFRRRAGFACVINYGDEPAELPGDLSTWKPVLASADAEPGTIAGASAVWLAP